MIAAEELRAAYLNRGMSRRQFAEELDVPEQSIRRLEAGKGVRPANAKKVADFLGVRVTDLLPMEERAA